MSTETSASKTRLHVLDYLILFLLVALIAVLGGRFLIMSNAEEDYVYAVVHFSVNGVSEHTAELLSESKTVYLDANNDEIGTILSASYHAAELYAKDGEGNLIKVAHPVQMTVEGQARLRGTWGEDGFLIDGTILATVGKSVSVYTENAACQLMVVSIETAP